ncbi:hypothetical protein [Phyllobacterium sp. SB3]|uniref:hypothetical protein n=1 Tax=Phyllobacterium sp. SB3 TaxID=3156073 RepID=UPI0032AF6B42
MAESRWAANQLGGPVLKAINNLHWRSLLDEGKPAGTSGRIALPVSGDKEAKVIRLFNELGFDGVDAGQLDGSWRQQPGPPVYAANLDAEGVRKALAQASPERKPEFRAAPNSNIGQSQEVQWIRS